MVNTVKPYAKKSLWAETDEKWDYRNIPLDMADWRVVGSKIPKSEKNICVCNDDKKDVLHEFSMLNVENDANTPQKIECIKNTGVKKEKCENNRLEDSKLYVIEFESGRLEIAFTNILIEKGTYVIVVADRGKDCGKIRAKIGLESFRSLVNKYALSGELVPKEILKIATDEDIEKMKIKREKEEEALKYCTVKNYLDMEIVSCEYQWDFNKLTFFFNSKDRVDFRELVKELYKKYKTRIWMCCVDKSKNWCLKELVDEYGSKN